MRFLLLAMCLATTACEKTAEFKQLSRSVSTAHRELAATLGVPVDIHVKAGDLESPRAVTITLSRMPAGLTPEQIERNANIVMRKAVPKIETVEVRLPQ
jgi:hypothetical protein